MSPQAHMDRLNAVDAAFLHQEGDSTHMHIGGAAIFEGPPPTRREFCDHIRSRLALVPRYRQKIAVPPIGLGRQRWVDDPRFNLDYHVRHTGLPRPGDEEQLRRLTARIFSQALDRTKPLWEIWVVEGLSDGRFALITKTHHALVDGVSGMDLMTMLFDLDPEPTQIEAEDSWAPRPEPTPVELSAAALGASGRAILSLPWRVAAAAHPRRVLGHVRDALEGIGELALNPAAPETPLNAAIGPHRRVAFVPASLDDFKLIKNTCGATVNDVVLAVVAGALRHFLHLRGLRVEGLELYACVPISQRTDSERESLGNRITQVVTPLPIHVADPLARLDAVRRDMDGVKQSKQALGAETIAAAQNFAPPTILAQASRLNFSSRFYNLLVTNVPGPQHPLYALGHRLEAIFPIAFLAEERALAVAVVSYDGGMNFGLIGDLDALADIDVIAQGIEDSLAELVAAAHEEGAAPPPARTPARTGGARTRRRPAVRSGGPSGSPGTRGPASAGANGHPDDR
jgi:diacylglycerol O-acyltransferase / wax synthase